MSTVTTDTLRDVAGFVDGLAELTENYGIQIYSSDPIRLETKDDVTVAHLKLYDDMGENRGYYVETMPR